MNFTHIRQAGGVTDVAENLLEALRPLCHDRLEVIRPRRRNSRAAQVFFRYLAEVALELRFWRRRAVALFPNYFIFPLPGSRLRRVVIVHDLQFKHLPAYTSRMKRVVLDLSYRCARRFADGVVFISDTTQQDFLRFYGPPRRSIVIYNPVRASESQAPVVSRPYPYAIANFHYYPHKNFSGLADWFRAIRSRWPELRLVITGNAPQGLERALGGDPGAQGIEHVGFVEKTDVLRLLQKAEFFVSLSRMEGFNMSAAEAAYLGRPLVLSDIPAHREIFTGAAFFVDPDNAARQAEAVLDYLARARSNPSTWSYRSRVEPLYSAAAYLAFMREVANGAAEPLPSSASDEPRST